MSTTIAEAAKEFMFDRAGKLKNEVSAFGNLKWWIARFGDTDLEKVDVPFVRNALKQRREEGIRRRRTLANGTVRWDHCPGTLSDATLDRYASALTACINHAHQLGLVRSPAPRVGRLAPPHARREFTAARWLTAEEAASLIEWLPDYLRQMARFALATGLRRANITGLKWADVDLTRDVAWVQAVHAKGKRRICVPLSADAKQVLLEQFSKRVHRELVFTGRNNEMVTNVTGDAWQKALKNAGLPKTTRFHDLRHTWASWHAMNGTPREVLQKLGGWANSDMVDVYASLSPTMVNSYAANARPISGR